MNYDQEITHFLKDVFSHRIEAIIDISSRIVEDGCYIFPYMLKIRFEGVDRESNPVGYNLYIHTKWRLVSSEGRILIADDDLFESVYYGKMKFLYFIRDWWKKNLPMNVDHYLFRRIGDLIIYFSNEDYLEVINGSSDENEIWRIVRDDNKRMFIVFGNGKIEIQESNE